MEPVGGEDASLIPLNIRGRRQKLTDGGPWVSCPLCPPGPVLPPLTEAAKLLGEIDGFQS